VAIADPGGRRRDHEIARQRELEAARHARAVDHGDAGEPPAIQQLADGREVFEEGTERGPVRVQGDVAARSPPAENAGSPVITTAPVVRIGCDRSCRRAAVSIDRLRCSPRSVSTGQQRRR
jgi:hypothetical protein